MVPCIERSRSQTPDGYFWPTSRVHSQLLKGREPWAYQPRTSTASPRLGRCLDQSGTSSANRVYSHTPSMHDTLDPAVGRNNPDFLTTWPIEAVQAAGHWLLHRRSDSNAHAVDLRRRRERAVTLRSVIQDWLPFAALRRLIDSA